MTADNSVPSHSSHCEGCGRYHGSVNVLLACLVRHLRESRALSRALQSDCGTVPISDDSRT